MILITGASGTVGHAVLDEVIKLGLPVRAMYRSEKDAAQAPAGVATVLADFSAKETLKPALDGITSLYLVCAPIPQLADLESNVLDACKGTDVKHIVLNSALGAGDYPKSFPSWHRIVEEKLKATGLSFTILRPNGFMQNILNYMAPSIRGQGVFYAAMGNAKTSFLDIRDIAGVAGKALAAPQDHQNAVYELNGPEAVTYAELAQRITRIAERPVAYVDIPESAQRQSMLGMGMPVWQVDALLDLQQYYTKCGGGEVTDVLPRLLGRPPIMLDAFIEENKNRFLA